MSRELLKRALDALNEGLMGTEAISLSEEIEAYLAQPEPEPVAWRALNFAEHGGVYAYRDIDEPFTGVIGNNVGQPLYTTPPDQSARVAELAADGVRLMETITELRSNLAALQYKREPLSDEQIGLLSTTPTFSGMHPDYLRDCVRVIEAAHGIKGE